jgi:hypothetical protein
MRFMADLMEIGLLFQKQREGTHRQLNINSMGITYAYFLSLRKDCWL